MRIQWAIVPLYIATLLLPLGAAGADDEENADLERKVEVLTHEVEELKAGREIFTSTREGSHGLAPAASKVYRAQPGISIGGYGEMLYENYNDPNKKDQIDFLRAVFYVGYKFNDHFLLNTEIEFEHANTGDEGSVGVEFAYLDFLWRDPLNVRAGLLLLPMGFINELHEPPIYLGTERPETERQILPTTWRENGAGVFGSYAALSYRAYMVNGFDAIGDGSTNDGFTSDGLRKGRQNGSKAISEDFAFVGRVDYEGVPGLLVGTSGYVGNSGQGAGFGALTSIVEGHADYRIQGVQLRGLLAYSHVDDADKINDTKGIDGTMNDSVGEDLFGYYIQAGYDVLHEVATEQNLIPYVRYEWLDTQYGVPTGFSDDPENNRSILTLGISYLPILNVVVKTDYQWHNNQAGTDIDQFNVAVGYLF